MENIANENKSAVKFEESEMYFININCNGITGKNHIYNKFDYEAIEELYKTCNDKGYPIVYNLIYKLALTLPKTKKIVTFSPDPAISSATIVGLAEKYMCGQIDGSQYTSQLRVIYLTSSPHLLTNYKEVTVENLRNSVISNAMCTRLPSFTGHKLVLNPEQFFLIGINENLLEDDQREALDNSEITYFTTQQMRKKGISNVMEFINEKIMSDPVMVIFDMSSTSFDTAPCVSRFFKEDNDIKTADLNGFDRTELKEIFLKINNENLVGLDITSFDFRIDNKTRGYQLTCETAKLPLSTLLGIKEKKINIFTEHSKFLIYRPIEQLSEFDVGWYILRGVPLDIKEQVIKHIDDDTITSLSIDIDGNGKEQTVLVTTTTMLEQENKSIFSKGTKITDCNLYQTEKTAMMFELINTAHL